MNTTAQSQPPLTALRRLIEAYDLPPVGVTQKNDTVEVYVRSVAALEVFADAVERPIVSEDGDRYVVAYEVEGVPALFWAQRDEPIKADHLTLELVAHDADHHLWRLLAVDGAMIARSAKIHASRTDMLTAAVVTFGLESPEALTPGSVWYGHGHETVVVAEVTA